MPDSKTPETAASVAAAASISTGDEKQTAAVEAAGQKKEKGPVVKKVKVTLLLPHTHRGVNHKPGDEIEIYEPAADRLRVLMVCK